MKSATQCLWDYSIDIMTMQDEFNCQLFAAMERYAEGYYENKIGNLKDGDHPDEIYPRAETWLKERDNWASEVNQLRKQVTAEREKAAKLVEDTEFLLKFLKEQRPYVSGLGAPIHLIEQSLTEYKSAGN